MSNDQPERLPESDADLEREIRAERKFSLAEAIGRMAGPGMMTGLSPVSRKQQAEAAIQEYLGHHLPDTAGVLPGVLLLLVGQGDLCSSTWTGRSWSWPIPSNTSSGPSTS